MPKPALFLRSSGVACSPIEFDIERVPLERVAEVWHRDQGGRRPVLIP